MDASFHPSYSATMSLWEATAIACPAYVFLIGSHQTTLYIDLPCDTVSVQVLVSRSVPPVKGLFTFNFEQQQYSTTLITLAHLVELYLQTDQWYLYVGHFHCRQVISHYITHVPVAPLPYVGGLNSLTPLTILQEPFGVTSPSYFHQIIGHRAANVSPSAGQ